jgi:pimeloyl-ACP methyl ester carboxylesterase
MTTQSRSIIVDGHRLEIAEIPGSTSLPAIVFLHDGLGSVSAWRDFPEQVSLATGCAAVSYSRYGHGRSDALEAPRDAYYMHHEAQRVLPELLRALRIDKPILFGHSDGASIAIIYAGSRLPVRALILEAPHVFVEDISLAGIRAAKESFVTGELEEKLARHHADPAKTFSGWHDIWLDPSFRGWNIEAFLASVTCPLLAIQGEQDEYGTMAQLDTLARGVRGQVEFLKLSGCGHQPHRQQPEVTLDAVINFVKNLST